MSTPDSRSTSNNTVTQEQFDAVVYLTYHEAFELTIGDTMEQVKARMAARDRRLRAKYPEVSQRGTIEEADAATEAQLQKERAQAFDFGWDRAEVGAGAYADTWQDMPAAALIAGAVHAALYDAIDGLRTHGWKMYAFAKLVGMTEERLALLAESYLEDTATLKVELPKRNVNWKDKVAEAYRQLEGEASDGQA